MPVTGFVKHQTKMAMRRVRFPFVLVAMVSLLFVKLRVAQAVDLAQGRFQTTTDVTSWLNLALDIADMRDTDDEVEKLRIYEEGQNSMYNAANGTLIPRSLASLSWESYPLMKDDAMYNYFRHAFNIIGSQVESEKLGDFDDQPVEHYGDTLVEDLFDLNVPQIEAEAALVINVWMYVTHKLYKVLWLCLDNGSMQEMNEALDIAAALWVGADQLEGDAERGNMLYNLAQVAGRRFGEGNGEAKANILLMDAFNALQVDISNDKCATEQGYLDMRHTVNEMFGFMSIPLIQQLLHHIVQQPAAGGSDFIELYSLSVAPRLLVCDRVAYDFVLDNMVFGEISSEVESKENATSVLQSAYSCFGVTCDQIGSYETGAVAECSDSSTEPKMLAGYPPTFDVSAYAYLDRDIIQIRTLVETEAYNAALDLYTRGFNGRLSSAEYVSLRDLAKIQPEFQSATQQYSLFESYFGVTDQADKTIIDVLTGQTPYSTATPAQRGALVAGTLANMVTFMAVLQNLYSGVKQCLEDGAGSTDASIRLWDQGVALFVGSTEGRNGGGQDYGETLYATAKSLCDYFGTCVDSGGAEINGAILDAFTQGSDDLTLGKCDEVTTLIDDTLVGALAVPLVQGTLLYAVTNSNLLTGANDTSLGVGQSFADAILPFVNTADADSAITISNNMGFDKSRKPVQDGALAVFSAFRTALPGMPTDCGLVGSYQEQSLDGVCPDGGAASPTAPSGSSPGGPSSPSGAPTPAPTVPGDPSLFGFGRYVFTTEVVGLSKIAYDVRDMEGSPDVASASIVYTNGGNSQILVNGVSQTLNIASFSTEAATYMGQDPMFNIFRYALLNDTAFENGAPSSDSAFANTVVQKALTVAGDVELAAEAAVVMNVWMEITHHLYETIQLCQEDEKATRHLDEAMALWLGADQSQAGDDGYLMYTIAQRASGRMGRSSGEASTNADLFVLFNAAKELAEGCSGNPSNAVELRYSVASIVRVMTIPLLQNLLYYIHRDKETESTNELELYTLSVIPQAISCYPGAFFSLEETLLNDATDLNSVGSEFFDDMKSLHKCLRITCADIFDGQNTDQALRSTVLDMCYEENGSDIRNIVGYNATTDVKEYLRLDLDVLQIGIFLETRAYDAALDLYENGSNHQGTVSLRDLVRQRSLSNLPEFQVFRDYYGSENFADDTVTAAIGGQGKFSQASRSQLTEVAVTTLQCLVPYLLVVDSLKKAVATCDAGDSGLEHWDRAVAFFVGSIEGESRGGESGGFGQLLYAFGKDMCTEFDTCESSGDASVNEELVESFDDGQDLMSTARCDEARQLIDDRILPSLPVSLVQGTLFYAKSMDQLESGTTDDLLGTGYAVSRVILPLVNSTNPESAATIDSNMDFQLSEQPVKSGIASIFDAITLALPGLVISCQDVGALDGLTVCPDGGEVRPPTDTSTTLGDGLYTTTTYVQDRANIALDILAIRNALNADTPDLAELIYKDGENSAIYDENGVQVGQRSLQKFSTQATLNMTGEPVFNFFRFALRDDDRLYFGQDVSFYADSIVRAALQRGSPSPKTLAVEAMVALNLWMFLVHELYETLDNCKNEMIADVDGVHSIDEAVAYWIGDGQLTGDPQRGHLLYALAEQTAELFNSDEGGQSRVNRNILRLFNQAKLELSFPGSCQQNPNTFPRLRQIVNRIVSWMVVPLIQSLVHGLRENDRYRVNLYANAFVPLVAGCSPSTFDFLSDKLLSMNYNVVEVGDIVQRIQTTYQCFGLRCEDIGTYQSDSADGCSDLEMLSPLAGYHPQADVRPYALLDLDILQASILMEMGAWEAAEDLYMHGKHAVVDGTNGPETLSFNHLATTAQRTIVPQFDSFARYFETDKYADVFIRQAIGTDESSAASDAQRRTLATKTMQFIILYMSALQLMHEAVADCQSTDKLRLEDGLEAWDRAAALLIGSLEGTDNGGSGEGLLFHALTKERCSEFNTCADTGNSEVNEQLISLLYTGRGAVSGRSCGALRKAVREIEPLLLVPLIQSTLHYALSNEKLEASTSDPGLAAGFVFSRSILPLVDDINRDSAATINKNMDLQFGQRPVVDGANTVFAELAKVYGPMGVDCELVGSGDSFDACKGATRPPSGSETHVGLIVGVVVGVLAVVALVWLFFAKKSRRRKKELEERPEFVTPTKGELNHDAELLNGVHNEALARDIEKNMALTPETSPMSSTGSCFTLHSESN